MGKQLDWIALMTYDYHGQWDKKTGHVAPMYAGDDGTDQTFNVVCIVITQTLDNIDWCYDNN